MVPISNVLNETEKLNKPKIERKTPLPPPLRWRKWHAHTLRNVFYFIFYLIWTRATPHTKTITTQNNNGNNGRVIITHSLQHCLGFFSSSVVRSFLLTRPSRRHHARHSYNWGSFVTQWQYKKNRERETKKKKVNKNVAKIKNMM